MDNSTSMVRMENWKAIIEQCQARPEGQTAKQWLAENGISDKKYYYWLRRIRRQAFEEMQKSLPAVSESSNKQISCIFNLPVTCLTRR